MHYSIKMQVFPVSNINCHLCTELIQTSIKIVMQFLIGKNISDMLVNGRLGYSGGIQ